MTNYIKCREGWLNEGMGKLEREREKVTSLGLSCFRTLGFEVSLKVRLGQKASRAVKTHLYRHTQNRTLKDTAYVHLTPLHPERRDKPF